MNRFTRNNLLLIVIIACSCVVAILLLIFSVIRYIGMNRCITEIGQISKEKEKLSNKNPSPHSDNRAPIEKNTLLHTEAAQQLEVYFKPLLKNVAEEFVKGLIETNPEKVDGKIVPLTVERFRKDYQEMWNKAQSYVDKQYYYKNFRELRYKNWTEMVRRLLPKAQKLTQEPLTEDTLPEVLFSYIGIPRVMGEREENMQRYLRNYQNALVNLLTSVKYNITAQGPRADWFGFDPSNLKATFNSPRDHYPQIAKVWDIYGDVLKRMTSCSMKIVYKDKSGKEISVPYSKDVENKLTDTNVPFRYEDDKVDTFHCLLLRAAMSAVQRSGSSNVNEALRNAVSGTDEGIFRTYRMRIIISASMAGIRTLVRALEEAYREHHVYLIRSIALYAERDGASEIFKNREEGAWEGFKSSAPAQAAASAPAAPAGRGRGRGRGAVAPQPKAAVQSKVDPAVLEEARRRQEEANKKLKFFERIGYGDVLIGDDKTYKAVIDFDCYELK